jgi:hypothetical protein
MGEEGTWKSFEFCGDEKLGGWSSFLPSFLRLRKGFFDFVDGVDRQKEGEIFFSDVPIQPLIICKIKPPTRRRRRRNGRRKEQHHHYHHRHLLLALYFSSHTFSSFTRRKSFKSCRFFNKRSFINNFRPFGRCWFCADL